MIGICAALVVAGCGGGDDDSSTGSSVAGSTAAATTTAKSSSVVEGVEPPIEVPKGPPPKKLVVKDLIKGRGDVARKGDEVTVQFAALRWNGEPFQSSWASGEFESFNFDLATVPHQVIPGWERGIPGMRVGGRRELVVPPQLIYYAHQDVQRTLRGSDSLVYVVDMLDVR